MNQENNQLDINLCEKIIDNMHGALAVYKVKDGNGDGTLKFYFTNYNKSAERIDGIKKEDILDKEVREVFPGADKMGITKVFSEVYRSGKAQYASKKIYSNEQGGKFYRDSYVFKLDQDHIATIYYDITNEESEKEKINNFVESILPVLHKVAMGDFRDRIELPDVKNEDRYTEIAVAINLMVDDLEDLQSELNKKSENLEKLVQEKTKEIVKSKEQYKKLVNAVENSSEAIFSTDLEYNVNSWNRGAEKMYGYTKDEIVGKSIAVIVPEKRKKELPFIKDELLNRKNIENFETQSITKDKKVFDVSMTISPLLNQDNVTGATVVARDISYKKDVERAEEVFYKAFEESSIGMALVAPEGNWLRVNNALCTILGYSKEELVKKTFQDITYKEDLNIDLGHVKDLLEGKIKTYSMEKRYIKKNGSMVWVNLTVSLVKDKLGRPDYFISQIEDITERKNSESVIENMFRFTDYMVCTSDLKKGYFTKVSPAFTKHLGWSEKELLSKPILSFIHPDDVDRTSQAIKDQLDEGKEIVKFENRYKTKDGKYKVLEWGSRFVPESNTTYSTANDITERKTSEEKEEKLRKNAEKMNELLVGRELKMIELKRELERCKKGMNVKSEVKRKSPWVSRFRDAVEIEEEIIRKLMNYYRQKIDTSSMKEKNKKEILKKLDVLITESKKHEAKFRGLINHERE